MVDTSPYENGYNQTMKLAGLEKRALNERLLRRLLNVEFGKKDWDTRAILEGARTGDRIPIPEGVHLDQNAIRSKVTDYSKKFNPHTSSLRSGSNRKTINAQLDNLNRTLLRDTTPSDYRHYLESLPAHEFTQQADGEATRLGRDAWDNVPDNAIRQLFPPRAHISEDALRMDLKDMMFDPQIPPRIAEKLKTILPDEDFQRLQVLQGIRKGDKASTRQEVPSHIKKMIAQKNKLINMREVDSRRVSPMQQAMVADTTKSLTSGRHGPNALINTEDIKTVTSSGSPIRGGRGYDPKNIAWSGSPSFTSRHIPPADPRWVSAHPDISMGYMRHPDGSIPLSNSLSAYDLQRVPGGSQGPWTPHVATDTRDWGRLKGFKSRLTGRSAGTSSWGESPTYEKVVSQNNLHNTESHRYKMLPDKRLMRVKGDASTDPLLPKPSTKDPSNLMSRLLSTVGSS